MRTVIALAVTLLVLAGCGDDGDGGNDSEGSEEPAAPTTQDGGCPYLGQDAVEGAVGGAVEVISAGEGACVFRAAADAEAPDALVTVTYTAIAIDVEEYADGTRDLCDDEPVEVDAGDIAFACTTFIAPQGFVYSGQDSVVVQVDDVGSDNIGVALAATLLPSVVP